MADIQRIADKIEHVAQVFESSASDREQEMTDKENEIERAAYQDCANFLRVSLASLLPPPTAAEKEAEHA